MHDAVPATRSALGIPAATMEYQTSARTKLLCKVYLQTSARTGVYRFLFPTRGPALKVDASTRPPDDFRSLRAYISDRDHFLTPSLRSSHDPRGFFPTDLDLDGLRLFPDLCISNMIVLV